MYAYVPQCAIYNSLEYISTLLRSYLYNELNVLYIS